jgi:hypothetical protein
MFSFHRHSDRQRPLAFRRQASPATCASAGYIAQHISHPEILAGIGRRSWPRRPQRRSISALSARSRWPAAPSRQRVRPGLLQPAEQRDVHQNNGYRVSVQFTDRTEGGNAVCVWHADVTKQTYRARLPAPVLPPTEQVRPVIGPTRRCVAAPPPACAR